MEIIYTLEQELEDNPGKVSDAQNLTLDESRPTMGLKGTYGLYGSNEWWDNLNNGVIPTNIYEGKISLLKREGMHNEGKAFVLSLTSGGTYSYSCVANNKKNLKKYQLYKKARVTTYIEPLKNGVKFEFVKSVEIENA